MTLTASSHPGLDQLDAQRRLAEVLLDEFDHILDGATADTSPAEDAVIAIGQMLALHTGPVGGDLVETIDEHLERIGSVLDHLEIDFGANTFADALALADRILDTLEADGYQLVRGER